MILSELLTLNFKLVDINIFGKALVSTFLKIDLSNEKVIMKILNCFN